MPAATKKKKVTRQLCLKGIGASLYNAYKAKVALLGISMKTDIENYMRSRITSNGDK